LGDAAHPMRPIGSQAGSQAVVDARVLALALATSRSVEEGLRAYEQRRLPAMNKIILKNREFGPSIIMDMAEERAPNGFRNIDEVIPRRELEEIALSFKVTAGFDPESLNSRESFDVKRA
jgi:2-polyprenyl-6-methoxyphenol hydroxylase-like FAD-dependent oxidoreductase